MSGGRVLRHDVLILGGGPAALSAARRLGELGIRDIAIIEREAALGGVPRHCGHLAFGLREFGRLLSGPAYAQRLAGGVDPATVRLSTTVTAIEPEGRIATVHPERGPERWQGRAVLLAFGVRETPRSARLVSGARPQGVLTTGALQQLVYLSGRRPFAQPVIIGSELVAFSALLTLRHGGMRAAAMIEPGPRILARKPADSIARALFGLPILTGTKLMEIRGLTKVEGVEIERQGRLETLACDGVIFTGQFCPETGLLAGTHLALDPGSGGPIIDQAWRSSDPAYFAAGNLLHPVETAGRCWAEGRAVAEAIAANLAGNLVPASAQGEIHVAAPLKYLYPQRWSWPDPGLPLSRLLFWARSTAACRGQLVLSEGGRPLWRRSGHFLPERRIALPLAHLPRRGAEMLKLELIEA